MDHILSIVLFTPLVGLLVLLFLPSSNARLIKLWANIAAFAGFLVSLPLVFNFDATKDYQFEVFSGNRRVDHSRILYTPLPSKKTPSPQKRP